MEEASKARNVVIGKDSDLGVNLGNGTNHLAALVGLRNTVDPELRGVQSLSHDSCTLFLGFDGDEYDLIWVCCEDTPDGLPKVASIALE